MEKSNERARQEDETKDKSHNFTDLVEKYTHPQDYQDLNIPQDTSYHGHKPKTLWERIAAFLANDIVAGMILICAALIALLFANSPFRELYQWLAEYELGWEAIHLKMPLSHWAQDGILTLFFFAVGLELKQEFVTGSLSNIKVATLPIIAAAFGMLGPASIYLLSTLISGDGAWHGWAIPTATDIAFAVAILQIFGRSLPAGARTFLLTLAVADDLGGIIVIALAYASGFNLLYLMIALVIAVIFGFFCQKLIFKWYILIPLGVLCWYFMHASGIHATIAGVILGMMVPAKIKPGHQHQPTEMMVESINPISAGFAVPLFAFFAAGVNIIDVPGGPLAMLTNGVTLSVILAMPLGKCLGIFGSVWVLTKFTSLRLGEGVTLKDIFPISFVAGIGFTVALLVSHLAFVGDNTLTQAGSFGVLLGTLTSVILGAIFLSIRGKQIKKSA